MDGAHRQEFPDQLCQPEAEGEYRDPSDRGPVETRIGKLQPHLQPVARLLSYGMTKVMVAERRGICTSTLYTQIAELRRAMS